MKPLPHLILETANFHNGDASQLLRAIETMADLDYPHKGIKFHAFNPDFVAMPDFSWYPIVKNFYLDPSAWQTIISKAVENNLYVWLDLFCVYGVEMLRTHLPYIYGIKFQPSILDNLEILDALRPLDLRDKVLIMNVSGLEISEIEFYVMQFQAFHFKEIVLQLGFQNYPTQIEDTSLKKLAVLEAAFPHQPLAYADHIDAQMEFARRFPVYAWLNGCTYLEKHICNVRTETKYDFDSALEWTEVKELTAELLRVNRCFSTPFISANERKYFNKTQQVPILKKPLHAGQLVADSDVMFRRTDKAGLAYRELKSLQQRFFLLSHAAEAKNTVTARDFKKARIGVIVACRMKSSRLKEKAILPIQGLSSIERCLENCLKFPNVDEVILATSTLPEDAVLGNYTLSGRVKFWQGDPDDVISRYLGACEKYDLDVVIRLTGDSPVISVEIADFILKSHFLTGADFTDVRRFAIGTNSQVYNVEALKRVIQLVGRADYSEHMTLYMTNNPAIFKINVVDLPAEWIRDYRLTLDYPEDLEMFNALFAQLAQANLDSSLPNIFNVLEKNPEIAQLNAHRKQIYNTDQELIRLLKEKTTITLPPAPSMQ